MADPSASVFAVRAWAFLAREPVLNNVLCTVVHAACGDRPGPDDRWIRVLRGNELVGVAVQTRRGKPLLSELPEDGALALVGHFVGTGGGLSAITGPPAASAAVATHYASALGLAARPGMAQRILRLDRLAPPVGVPGRARPATPADRDTIVAWVGAFSAEALAGHDPGAADDGAVVDRRLRHRGDLMWFWERDGQPVSFAWRSPLPDPRRWPRISVVRVSAVYTPPGHRGCGYASANVAALSQRSLEDGASACMLYTDAANPTSNKIYERIGYRQVGAGQDWLFS